MGNLAKECMHGEVMCEFVIFEKPRLAAPGRKKPKGGGVAWCIRRSMLRFCTLVPTDIQGCLALEIRLPMCKAGRGSKSLLAVGLYFPPENSASKMGGSLSYDKQQT